MNRIPEAFIDELLSRTDIVEVVDTRVKLKKSGKNYSACCPFHKEKTPSFTVSPDKQFYYCFGCGASGTAISFLMEYEHQGFVDAIESLASLSGLTVPKEKSDKGPKKSHKNLYTILEKARQFYELELREHPQKKQAVNYLQDRGLDGSTAKYFGIGYAPPGWDNLLRKLGLNDEDIKLLIDSGMITDNPESGKRYDRFRNRIMFPITDVRGRIIGFGGRILGSTSEPQGANARSGSAGPKYLNSPETPVFHKGRELYGLYQCLQSERKIERLLVVEGYMDVIALAQYGIRYSVATLGTACGEDHLKLAFRYTKEIIFCFDGDNAGRKAATRALENSLPAMEDGRQIRFLFLPEGQDPDTLVRQVGAERFSEQMTTQAVPMENYFFDAVANGLDIRTMEGRAGMSKRAAPLLNKLPRGVFRELMFDQLAQRTGLSLDVLQELMAQPATELNTQHTDAPSTQAQQGESNPPPWQQEEASTPPPDYEQYHQRADEPPFAEPPAQRSPVATAAATRLNPAKLAISLLLENSNLLDDTVNSSLPPTTARPELELLQQLIDYLQQRPGANFNNILGYWAGKFGLDAQNQLASIVANQFLSSAKSKPKFDPKQELMDALERLRRESITQTMREEIKSLSQVATLDDAQKARLRELLSLQVTQKPSEQEKQ